MRGNSSRSSGNYRNPCITMHQPWASLLVYGIKRIEGRSWPSPITGRLWIHAASKVPEESTIKAMEYFYNEIYALNGITDLKFPQHYPVSRLLGCVEVVGCLTRDELACWEMVPEGVRLEAQTDYCWLCERTQRLLSPFEMRGYQGVYNLESKVVMILNLHLPFWIYLELRLIFSTNSKIYETAVRGLSLVDCPLPVKFPLPDPQDPFSLKPGSISALNPNLKPTEVDKSSSLAIAGALAEATQFSKKDHNFQNAGRNNAPDKMNINHEETEVSRSYNLRSRSWSMEKDNISSTELNKKFDDGAFPSDHEEKSSSKMSEGSSSHNQSPGDDRRQHIRSPTKEEDNCNYFLWCDETPGIFRGDVAGNDDELWKVKLMGRADAMMREQKLKAEVMAKLMANIDVIMIEQSQQADLLVKLIGKIDATIIEQKQQKFCLIMMCFFMILFVALWIGRLTV